MRSGLGLSLPMSTASEGAEQQIQHTASSPSSASSAGATRLGLAALGWAARLGVAKAVPCAAHA